MQQQFTCHLLSVAGCQPEHQRYFALVTWLIKYPELSWPSRSTLSSFLDRLITDASDMVSRPKVNFQRVYFSASGNTYEVDSFRFGRKYFSANNSSNRRFVLLNSTDLIIVCQLNRSRDHGNFFFSSVNVTINFPKQTTPPSITYNFTRFRSPEFSNG